MNNSLFNRFLVAGAGGGSDNADNEVRTGNDGSGGSGGFPGQGFWLFGTYQSQNETTSENHFSFGYGQNCQKLTGWDYAGAGSGFYGGVSSVKTDAGGAGGSSFALMEGADIPEGYIEVKNSAGEIVDCGYYALKDAKEYYLRDVVFATGVWIGDGKARITYVGTLCQLTCIRGKNYCSSFMITMFFIINYPHLK